MKDEIVIGGVAADMDDIEDIEYIMNVSFVGNHIRTLTQSKKINKTERKPMLPSHKKDMSGNLIFLQSQGLFSVRGFN